MSGTIRPIGVHRGKFSFRALYEMGPEQPSRYSDLQWAGRFGFRNLVEVKACLLSKSVRNVTGAQQAPFTIGVRFRSWCKSGGACR